MKNATTRKGVIETYQNKFLRGKSLGIISKAGSECILFCKKVTPNVFSIKDGFAIVPGAKDCFNDGICMISNFTKVVFVFDQTRKQK